MRGLKLLVLMLVGLGAAVVAAWMVLRPAIERSARSLIVRGLEAALDAPVELASLGLSAVPPVIEAAGLRIGEGGSLLRAGDLRVRLLPLASLAAVSLAAEVDARDVWVDVPALDAALPSPPEGAPLPRLAFRAVEIRGAGVRVVNGKDPVDLSLERLAGTVDVGGTAGVFRVRAETQAFEVLHRDAAFRFERAVLRGGDAGRGLTIEDLEAHGEGIEVSARAVPGDAPAHRLAARIGLDLLSVLDESLRGLAGNLSVEANLDGPLLDPRVEATLAAAGVALPGLPLGRVRAEIVRAGDWLEIDTLEAAPLGGRLEITGRLGLTGALPVDLRGEWHDVDPAALLAGAGIEALGVQNLRVAGSAELSATLRPLSLQGRASGTIAAPPDDLALDWSVEGSHERDRGHVRASLGKSGAASARAEVQVHDAGTLGGKLRIEVADARALRAPRFSSADLRGTLRLSGEIGGALRRPTLRGELSAARLAAFGVEADALTARFEIDRERLSVEALALESGEGRVAAGGRLSLAPGGENEWWLRAERLPLDRVLWPALRRAGFDLPVSRGLLAAELAGRGRWSAASVDGRLQVESFSFLDEPFERFAVTAVGRLPEWSAEAALTHDAGMKLDARLSGRGAETLAATVAGGPFPLETLGLAERAGLRGTARLRAEVQGPLDRLGGRVDLEAGRIVWKGRSLGDLRLDGEGNAGRWQLASRLLGDTLRIAGSIDQRSASFGLGVDWNETNFGPLLAAGAGIDVEASGSLRLTGSLSRPLGAEGGAEIEQLRVRRGPLEMRATLPIRVRRTGGTVTVEPFLLQGNGTELRASGSLGQGGAGELSVAGHGSLGLLELLGEPVRSARGGFELNARAALAASGEIDWSGQVTIERAALDVGLPIGPTRTSGRLLLSGRTVQVENLSGRLGGGTFALSGSADLESGLDLAWRIDEISTGLVPSLEHELSGSGTVRGPWAEPTVGGDIRIVRMLYDRRIALTDFLPSFRRDLAPPRRARPGVPVRLDLRVFAPGDIFIDNNFARIEARADLRVRGTVDDLRLAGPVEVLDGEVFFRGRTFEITNAVVEFQPKLRMGASLNIQAESEIETEEETYTVSIRVEGTTENYRVTMAADDASLTQTDVASLIAFGKTTAQMQKESRGFSLTDLLELAPGHIEEKAERGAARYLRLDRVEFEPTVSRETGQFEPQVTLGKKLTEDLTATLSTTFGVNAGETMALEYQWTPGFSLLGNWESQTASRESAVGGGVRFRRRFRSVPGFSLLGSYRPEDADARP